MDSGLVSIIIPIYKVEKYICKCIESVINQTYKNLEIILVDDGSPDNCPLICDEYAKKDGRIVVKHKKNGGLSDARNTGLDIANGEYLFFLDSDDYIAEDAIEKLYRILTETNSDLAICNYEYVSESGILDILIDSPIKNEVMDRDLLFTKLTEQRNWFYVVAWNKLYKKSLFNNLRFPVGQVNEDEFIVHKVFLKCKQGVSITDKLYFYLKREGSITTSAKSIKRLDVVKALADRCDFLFNNGYYAPIDKSFSNMHSIYFRHRKEYIKSNKKEIKELDVLFKTTFRKCRSKLSFMSKLMGVCPHLMCFIKSLRRKTIEKSNYR